MAAAIPVLALAENPWTKAEIHTNYGDSRARDRAVASRAAARLAPTGFHRYRRRERGDGGTGNAGERCRPTFAPPTARRSMRGMSSHLSQAAAAPCGRDSLCLLGPASPIQARGGPANRRIQPLLPAVATPPVCSVQNCRFRNRRPLRPHPPPRDRCGGGPAVRYGQPCF